MGEQAIKKEDLLRDPVNHFAKWVVIHAITQKRAHKDEGDWKAKVFEHGSDELKIVFTVNGVDLPFLKTILDIEKQLDRMIANEAKELLEGKLHDSFDKLEEVCQEAQRKICKHFGIELEEE